MNGSDYSVDGTVFPPRFEPHRESPIKVENQNEIDKGESEIQEDKTNGLEVESEDDVLKEAKRSWELRKSFGLSALNEIDSIWAMAKNRRDRKGKKNGSTKAKRSESNGRKAKD